MLAIHAAEQLGIAVESFMRKQGKYRKYYKPGPKGTRGLAEFDLAGYLMEEEFKMDFIAKAELFIEYLVHVKKITYYKIEKDSGAFRAALNKHPVPYPTSIKVVKKYQDQLEDFNAYYGWRKTSLDKIGEIS